MQRTTSPKSFPGASASLVAMSPVESLKNNYNSVLQKIKQVTEVSGIHLDSDFSRPAPCLKGFLEELASLDFASIEEDEQQRQREDLLDRVQAVYGMYIEGTEVKEFDLNNSVLRENRLNSILLLLKKIQKDPGEFKNEFYLKVVGYLGLLASLDYASYSNKQFQDDLHAILKDIKESFGLSIEGGLVAKTPAAEQFMAFSHTMYIVKVSIFAIVLSESYADYLMNLKSLSGKARYLLQQVTHEGYSSLEDPDLIQEIGRILEYFKKSVGVFLEENKIVICPVQELHANLKFPAAEYPSFPSEAEMKNMQMEFNLYSLDMFIKGMSYVRDKPFCGAEESSKLLVSDFRNSLIKDGCREFEDKAFQEKLTAVFETTKKKCGISLEKTP